jgi:hypothetical protein
VDARDDEKGKGRTSSPKSYTAAGILTLASSRSFVFIVLGIIASFLQNGNEFTKAANVTRTGREQGITKKLKNLKTINFLLL